MNYRENVCCFFFIIQANETKFKQNDVFLAAIHLVGLGFHVYFLLHYYLNLKSFSNIAIFLVVMLVPCELQNKETVEDYMKKVVKLKGIMKLHQPYCAQMGDLENAGYSVGVDD